MQIIDTHQHIWDLGRLTLPWLAGALSLDRSFLPADYHEASAGTGISATVYMEVDVAPEQQDLEAETVFAYCADAGNPMRAAVLSARPADPGFAAQLGRYAANPYFRGIRQVLHGGSTPPGFCLREPFIRGIRYLGDAGFSYDLCLRSAELDDARALAVASPQTQFILDHCGNANIRWTDVKQVDQWCRDITALAECQNVVCKISGIVASAQGAPWSDEDLAPYVNHCLDAFGPSRVMFGGDWPVCTLGAPLRDWVDALRRIVAPRPEPEQRMLFSENALRIYRIAATA